MIPLILLVLAAPVTTSTASAWQKSGARWERLAEETYARALVLKAERDEARAEASSAHIETALVKARAMTAVASANNATAKMEAELSDSVSKRARLFSVVGVGVCAVGVVGFGWAMFECADSTCREVVGLITAGLAAAGCVTAGMTW